MDNEATKILNVPQNNETKKETVAEPKVEKKDSFGARMAATAAGAALGTGAAMAADHIFTATAVEAEEESVESEVVEAVVEEAPQEVETVTATVQPEPQHTVVEHVVTVKVEQAPSVEPQPMAQQTAYEPETEQPSVSDDEVHVVGVVVQDNGQGGMATLAGLQQGNETAVVVDVDSDGTIDVIAVDENHDGQYTANEIHDVSGEGLATANVIEAYVEEAHAHDAVAVVVNAETGEQYGITENEGGYGLTALEEMTPDMNSELYTASNDDMPDYMNDADPGFMEA